MEGVAVELIFKLTEDPVARILDEIAVALLVVLEMVPPVGKTDDAEIKPVPEDTLVEFVFRLEEIPLIDVGDPVPEAGLDVTIVAFAVTPVEILPEAPVDATIEDLGPEDVRFAVAVGEVGNSDWLDVALAVAIGILN